MKNNFMFTPYRNIQKTQVIASACAAFFLTVFMVHPASAAPSSKKLFKADHVGKLETIIAKQDDNFMDLAPKHGVGYTQLVAANPNVDPWLPGEGTEIILPKWHLLPNTTHEGLVLNTGELLLYYFPEDGSAPKTFPIGIGREGLSTPLGQTTITRKAQAPTWRPTPRMRQENPELPAVVPPGPKNPLGAHALYLGWPSYLIHGTDNEKGIGRRASSGCIRMYKGSIEWLYKHIKPNTKVMSVIEPIKMGWIDGDLYLEAEPSDLQIDELEYKNRQITVEIPDGTIQRIRRKAGKDVARVNWETVRTTLINRTGIPVKITQSDKDITETVATSNVKKDAAKKADKVKEQAKSAQTEQQKRRSDWDNLN